MNKVVVVDDQRSVREILQNCLAEQPELEVVGFAHNGQEAIEQVEKLSPDLVLMDIEMPIMDGLTATKIISEHFASTKVLLLTIKDDKQELARALEVGARGYILKNTNPQELIQIILLTLKGFLQVGPIETDYYTPQSFYSSQLINKQPEQSLDAKFALEKLISRITKLQETVLVQNNSLSSLKNQYAFGQELMKTKLNSERFFSELKNISFESRKMKLRLNKIERSLMFAGAVFFSLIIFIFILLILLIVKVFFF